VRDAGTVWGTARQAWRFPSEAAAREMVDRELGVPVIYRTVELSDPQ
jgi:hypothetical protein